MTEKWLIWSNEHKGWWRPNEMGYTGHKELAGRYTFEKALEIVKDCNRHKKWEHTPDEEMPVPNETMFPAD